MAEGVSGATIGGGSPSNKNAVTDHWGTVAGGLGNQAGDGEGTTDDRFGATVGGGFYNRATGAQATVPGGVSNHATGDYSFAAGVMASANHTGSFVWSDSSGGAFSSVADDTFAVRATGGVTMVVGSGGLRVEPNAESPNLVGGHSENSAAPGAAGATVAGGGQAGFANHVTDRYGTVSGGLENQAGNVGTVGGGETNAASGEHATVGGGWVNTASGLAAVVTGGRDGTAEAHVSAIGGGSSNSVSADGEGSTIAGGWDNTITASRATIAGGETNTASGRGAAIGGGWSNTAGGFCAAIAGGHGSTAGGLYGTVPGGEFNAAAGAYSFAAGRQAKANHDGSFVWGDSNNVAISSTGINQFVARVSGGVWFWTNSAATVGATLAAGSGTWGVASDRNLKDNFAPVDSAALLESLARVPVMTWNYRTQDASIRHMGPVAQDFHAAFGLGENDKTINTVDADGVALAAIQGLYVAVQQKDARIAELETRLLAQEAANAALQADAVEQRHVNVDLDARLAALEAQAGGRARPGQWSWLGLAAAGLAVGVLLTRRGGFR